MRRRTPKGLWISMMMMEKNRSDDFDEGEAFLDDTIKEEDKARKEAVSEERLVDANQDGVNDV